MKYLFPLVLVIIFISCESTKNMAIVRNAELWDMNQFETYRFWRELDIFRIKNNILKVKIGILPDETQESTIIASDTNTQVQSIYDSIVVDINKKNAGFEQTETKYFESDDQEKLKMFEEFKSGSGNSEFLSAMEDNLYIEQYREIAKRINQSIQSSRFYSSQHEFENYLRDRSIIVSDKSVVRDIFGEYHQSDKGFTKDQLKKLEENSINFIILFIGSYNLEYQEESSGHIGSETIMMKLIYVKNGEEIVTVKTIHYWG